MLVQIETLHKVGNIPYDATEDARGLEQGLERQWYSQESASFQDVRAHLSQAGKARAFESCADDVSPCFPHVPQQRARASPGFKVDSFRMVFDKATN